MALVATYVNSRPNSSENWVETTVLGVLQLLGGVLILWASIQHFIQHRNNRPVAAASKFIVILLCGYFAFEALNRLAEIEEERATFLATYAALSAGVIVSALAGAMKSLEEDKAES
jgi:uncharacterized membrane protein